MVVNFKRIYETHNFPFSNVPQYDINSKDNRGRSPLFLAVTLQHLNCVKTLLANKCNVEGEFDGWSIVQESVCTGDPDILTTVLEVRDLQRYVKIF